MHPTAARCMMQAVVTHKVPRSVQVVVYSETPQGREFLLLKRVDAQGGFWQSVTGSLEENETHAEAAVREIREETGILVDESELEELGLVNVFEIAPQWRHKYSPGTTHNEEVCLALRVNKRDIRIDASEHQEYRWVDFTTAIGLAYWSSTRKALMAVGPEARSIKERVDETG